ncbi:peptide deformylase 2-like [Macrosteles quadrilineatus]|uniref:peptide deformylase 2-like n=1 Tax=Macrosteles quadrilineatus TaxID=74068 RepID=UPI0023E31294|nr:peptide deformylase 2-like [Macrosteles quadrilineatus]
MYDKLKVGRFLRDYIVADLDDLDAVADTTLRKVADPLKFPLSYEDKEDILDLHWRFDSGRDGIVGLAAPQVGLSKRIIMIGIREDMAEQMETQMFEKTVWVNPRFYSPDEEIEEGWEQCRSVKNYVGLVPRYKNVVYSGFHEDGRPIRGRASGFAARIIQHEIDHLDGKLFIDRIPREKLMTEDEYMKEFHSPDERMEKEIDGPSVPAFPKFESKFALC